MLRAVCQDCSETHDGDVEDVGNWAERHRRKEQHDVSIERVETDGGRELPVRIDWPFEAVVHGADLHRDCLALTGDGSTCSNQAYRGEVKCGIHKRANDPDLIAGGHQWARIRDNGAGGAGRLAVCVQCEQVWRNGTPPLRVACPRCGADPEQHCSDATDGARVSAPRPAHVRRRERAREEVDDYERCPEPGVVDVDEDQQQLVTDGGHAPGPGISAAGLPTADRGREWMCRICGRRYYSRPEVMRWGADHRPAPYCSRECHFDDVSQDGDRDA